MREEQSPAAGFLAFAWDAHYPQGARRDFVGRFPVFAEAFDAAASCLRQIAPILAYLEDKG